MPAAIPTDCRWCQVQWPSKTQAFKHMLSCAAKPQRKGRAICRYCKKRHQSGHELTSHLRKGCPKKPVRQRDDSKLWKEPNIKTMSPLPRPTPVDGYKLDFGLPESPPPPGLVKINTGYGSYMYGLPSLERLPEFKPKAILQRKKPTQAMPPALPPPTLTDIIQAVKEALPPEPVQLIPEHLEFISDTVARSLNESNLCLQDSLAEAMEAHQRWLAARFRAIPEVTDWDMEVLFQLERQQTRGLLDQAIRELKGYIRERTPPPEYRA
jgi:hypothetical protein